MKFLLLLVALSTLPISNLADIYMHSPRGSNNRNCEKNENRQNGQRLFDSQNNDAGGYACPRAEPFACYNLNGAAKAACNNQNQNNENANMVSSTPPHNLNNQNGLTEYTAMTRMAYVQGSVVPVTWTAQHGAGTNADVVGDIIIQYSYPDTQNLDSDMNWRTTLTDDCGTGATGNQRCIARDGTPVQNGNDNLNGRATNTIPFDTDDQDDYRYGRHETYQYYRDCKRRERNKGLWLADQKLNPQNVNHDATFSRQNPNGDNDNNKNGLECPEESEYYPYWHPTPWRDAAIITNNAAKCAYFQAESQNVKAKNYCLCSDDICGAGTNANPGGNRGQLPNNERACIDKGGTWQSLAAFNIPPPECIVGDNSRPNSLGNVAGNGQMQGYNWTIPAELAGVKGIVLRVRYNMSSMDFDALSTKADSRQNGDNSLLIDREDEDNNNGGREAESYLPITGLGAGSGDGQDFKLGFAINTDQYARGFQDRSYIFDVMERNVQTAGACAEEYTQIYNLGVRGKRGNIVQAYPSVEYDFVPTDLVVNSHDCVHVQWTGSDYNPDRNPNNGEGGPPDANNDNQARADRSNIVQMNSTGAGNNYPGFDAANYKMFDTDVQTWTRLAFLDQPIGNRDVCQSINTLINTENNRQDRERSPRNCMKLSGQRSPYFNAGVVKAGTPGTYQYMSTRNNNFSNRGQKGTIIVKQGAPGSENPVGAPPADPTNPDAPPAAGIAPGTDNVDAAEKCKWAQNQNACESMDCKWDSTSCYSTKLSSSSVAVIAVGVVVGVGVAAALAVAGYRKFQASSDPSRRSKVPSSREMTHGSSHGSSKRGATALYDHQASEGGELAFRKGDRITVTKRDPSGWWTGTNSRTGETGIFPANHVKA